ncbi:Ubiquinone biosynthesis accessory factor UbiJ [Sinobacterium norvegicum]|uniref:Ubiquinone biosynthesis accessory factor UbiJ n=1 Tax=Sinobacterium norvegicum TaxID=1641715 RepID=A0ABM9AFN2_9GAMM|nr:SCP2 sterol-binding domain-containing protein [Sinobacterium norvegicum]CAH0991840.1 Ubiquinone biosynthesis accessory factor UbiJ [Sinobacterium norvegicum]
MIIHPTIHTAGLAALEQAINVALRFDPGTQGALAELDQRVFHIEITQPSLDFFLCPEADYLSLRGFNDGVVDTHLRGSASEFVQLVSADDAASALINGDITLTGDSAPLMQLQGILKELDIDWEAAISQALGGSSVADMAANTVGSILRGGFNFGRKLQQNLQRQTSDYILEEGRLSPPKAELEDFYQQVGKLANSTERLQARVDRLASKLAKQ